MAVRCPKCGEELIGAVNRCWKCGQTFALRPEADGRPPVRGEVPLPTEKPIAAKIVEEAEASEESNVALTRGSAARLGSVGTGTMPVAPGHKGNRAVTPQTVRIGVPFGQRQRKTTAELIDAKRASMTAMGGTVGSLVLGLFAAGLAMVWAPAAMVAVLGLVMGIWGLYSPRRNWALLGMLLCCLAIGVGAYTGVRRAYVYYQANQPAVIRDDQTSYPP